MGKTQFSKAFDFVGSIKPNTVTIKDHRIFATKAGVTVSTPIEEDIELCADYESLKLALSASKDNAAVTIENLKLSVNTEDVNIYVGLRDIEIPEPDPMVSLLEEPFILAVNSLSQFLKRDKDNPALLYFCVNGSSIVASDGNNIFEWFHGESLPTNLFMSKLFCEAVKKSKGRDVWGAGASDSSLTLHFSDGSWIRGESWVGEWLPFFDLLLYPVAPDPIADLKPALAAVKRFCSDGWVYLSQDRLSSDPGAVSGASREVEGLQIEGVFGLSALIFASENCNMWELSDNGHLAVFGENVRGLIGACVK